MCQYINIMKSKVEIKLFVPLPFKITSLTLSEFHEENDEDRLF